MIKIISRACTTPNRSANVYKTQCPSCGELIEFIGASSPYSCHKCGSDLPDFTGLEHEKWIRLEYHLKGEAAITVDQTEEWMRF